MADSGQSAVWGLVALLLALFAIAVIVLELSFEVGSRILSKERRKGRIRFYSEGIFRVGVDTLELYRLEMSNYLVRVPSIQGFCNFNLMKGHLNEKGIIQNAVLRNLLSNSSYLSVGYCVLLALAGTYCWQLGKAVIPTQLGDAAVRGFALLTATLIASICLSAYMSWRVIQSACWWDIVSTVFVRMPTELVYGVVDGYKTLNLEEVMAGQKLSDNHAADSGGERNVYFSELFYKRVRNHRDIDKLSPVAMFLSLGIANLGVATALLFSCGAPECVQRNSTSVLTSVTLIGSVIVANVNFAFNARVTRLAIERCCKKYFITFCDVYYRPVLKVGNKTKAFTYEVAKLVFKPSILDIWRYFLLSWGQIVDGDMRLIDLLSDPAKHALMPPILGLWVVERPSHADLKGFSRRERELVRMLRAEPSAPSVWGNKRQRHWNQGTMEQQLEECFKIVGSLEDSWVEALAGKVGKWTEFELAPKKPDQFGVVGGESLESPLPSEEYPDDDGWAMLKLGLMARIAKVYIDVRGKLGLSFSEQRKIWKGAQNLRQMLSLLQRLERSMILEDSLDEETKGAVANRRVSRLTDAEGLEAPLHGPLKALLGQLLGELQVPSASSPWLSGPLLGNDCEGQASPSTSTSRSEVAGCGNPETGQGMIPRSSSCSF